MISAKSRARNLTGELLSLYTKYGRDEFDSAIRELREGKIAETIASAAEALALAATTAKGNPAANRYQGRGRAVKQTGREMLLRYISILEGSNDATKVSVAMLLRKIVSRDVLPSTSSLKGCLQIFGVPVGPKLDRFRSARMIADHLLTLPHDEAKTAIENIEQMKGTQSSLQRWTDIIVKSDQRK